MLNKENLRALYYWPFVRSIQQLVQTAVSYCPCIIPLSAACFQMAVPWSLGGVRQYRSNWASTVHTCVTGWHWGLLSLTEYICDRTGRTASLGYQGDNILAIHVFTHAVFWEIRVTAAAVAPSAPGQLQQPHGATTSFSLTHRRLNSMANSL